MWTRVLLCGLMLLGRVADTLSDTTVAPDTPTTAPTGGGTTAPEPELAGVGTEQTLVLAGQITLDPGDIVVPGGDIGGDVGAHKTAPPPLTEGQGGGGGGGTTGTDGMWSSETATAGQALPDDSTATQRGTDTATQGQVNGGDNATNPSSDSTTLPPVVEAGTTAETAAATGGVTEAAVDVTTGAITSTLRPWPEDDPCHPSQHTLLEEDARHYSRKGDEGSEALSDSELKAGWYAFSYMDQSAIITPTCIKESQCSTIMPYHLSTDSLPEEIGKTTPAVMCGPGRVAGEINCCLKPVNIEIRNCQTHYIFNLEKVPLESASLCTQLKDEVVPGIYHAIPPTEQTTAAVTTTPRPTLPWVEHQKDDKGIVTVEYTFSKTLQESNYLIEDFDPKFRRMIAEALNNITEAPVPTVVIREGDDVGDGVKKTLPDTQVGPEVPDVDSDAGVKGPEDMRRRRNAGKCRYTEDDVKYVAMTPTTTGETLQVPIYVQDPDTERVPTDTMMTGLKNLEDSGQISNDVGVPMIRYYEGLPDGISPVGRRTDAGMWDRHRDLLITLIVLISICLLIILIGLLCLRCRKSRGSWSRDDDKVAMEAGYSGKKRPLVQENPLSDREIMKDEASMVERDNPAMTSNGGGGHLSKKDDDNGWVVPIDELSTAEKEKPEVEDTKL